MHLNLFTKSSSNPSSTSSPNLKSSPPASDPSDQSLYHTSLLLLCTRCFTATLSICLLGLTASYVRLEARTDIGVPAGLRYYIACSAISTLITLYTLSLSLPLLRAQGPQTLSHAQSGSSRSIYNPVLSKRWIAAGMDVVLTGLWIAAAVLGQGSAPHFYTKGVNLQALGIVMAVSEVISVGVLVFGRGFREARR